MVLLSELPMSKEDSLIYLHSDLKVLGLERPLCQSSMEDYSPSVLLKMYIFQGTTNGDGAIAPKCCLLDLDLNLLRDVCLWQNPVEGCT